MEVLGYEMLVDRGAEGINHIGMVKRRIIGMETELGFNPVADGKGYGVDILKLHKWMIDRAINLGILLPPRNSAPKQNS